MKHQWFRLNHLQACRLKYELSRQCIIFANKDAWMIHCVFDVIFNHGSILNLLNITWRVIKICYRSVLYFVSVCKQCSPVREDFIWKKNTKHKGSFHKKTMKHMENSICWGGSFSICYHERFLLHFVPF